MKNDFNSLVLVLNRQWKEMCKHPLFVVNCDKNELWATYLHNFTEEDNPIYLTNTEHDCNCCRSYINKLGNVIAITPELEVMTLWDKTVPSKYQASVSNMQEVVVASGIRNSYLTKEATIGTDKNFQQLEDGSIKEWNHFCSETPSKAMSTQVGKDLSELTTNHKVFKSSIELITEDAFKEVLELIGDPSRPEEFMLYKGQEYKSIVETGLKCKQKVAELLHVDVPYYYWLKSSQLGYAARIKNTVIGTLLMDLSKGVDSNTAVKSYEAKVAPENYKRPTSMITPGMVKKAEEGLQELGLEPSIHRRYATIEDVKVTDVLYADKSFRGSKSLLSNLLEDIPDTVGDRDRISSMKLQELLDTVLPTANSIELLYENSHTNNLMSIIAPINEDAPNILKWDNNFSWSYNGEVADSMKERVQKAGGKVDGVLRFSIQWNEDSDNQVDLDAHCVTPNKTRIYYSQMDDRLTKGNLDVDVINPGNKIAVENITFPIKNKLSQGTYQFLVHNFHSNRSTKGFTAEVEFEGKIHKYTYNKSLKGKEKVPVAKVQFEDGKFSIESDLNNEVTSKSNWNITTNKFHRVSNIMHSPNHWTGNKVGNKHTFFILDKCINDKSTRGFYNEYLRDELQEHRKVFEVLGSKMKVPESNTQLSGLGFSVTKPTEVIVRVNQKQLYKVVV